MSDNLAVVLEELREIRSLLGELKGWVPPGMGAPEKCRGVTGKGDPCRNRARGPDGYCRMHGNREAKRSPGPRESKRGAPKMKKVQPEHTCHDGGSCKLCDTHGDVWDPTLPEAGFEGCSGVV